MFKKGIKLFFELVLMIIVAFCMLWHNLVVYGISQGIGQITIIWKAEPIEKVLKDDSFPDSLKQKLILIQEIKKYAVDSLGIKPGNNYSSVYN